MTARLLIGIGIACILTGAAIRMGVRIPWLGHLPGDICIRRGGSVFYFPLTTCILLSMMISVIMRLFFKK